MRRLCPRAAASAQSPASLRGSVGLGAPPWGWGPLRGGRARFICKPPPSLHRHPATLSITSVSQRAQSTAILLFSSILLTCSIFLYAKYVEAINTLTCRRCAAREECPFGRLFPFPASPARRTSAGAWIPLRDGEAGSERRATRPGSWGWPLPSLAMGTLLGLRCRLADPQIPSEMSLFSVYLCLFLTSRGGNAFRWESSKSCARVHSAARARARGKGRRQRGSLHVHAAGSRPSPAACLCLCFSI